VLPDDKETLVDGKGAAAEGSESSRRAPSSLSAPGGADSVAGYGSLSRPLSSPPSTMGSRTAADALHEQEVDRTRVFIRLAQLLVCVVAIAGVVAGGDGVAQAVLYGGLVLVLGSTAWLSFALRKDGQYTTKRALPVALANVLGALCGIYYFGVFSPAVVVLPFGLYFFSAAQDFRATMIIFAECAGLYLALVVLVMLGVVVDRGLLVPPGGTLIAQAVVVAMVETILFATFLIARSTRTLTLLAIDRHNRAQRGLIQREALLKEARLDLDRALRVGGLGRFSETVLGSYRLGKVIGRGAFGEVYEATHVETQQLVAVKLLNSGGLASADLVKRFLREAKIAASLRVPNVVRVLEIGGLEAELPYIVMERLIGEDLGQLLGRERTLNMAKTVALVRQVGAGLLAARAAGIVHRDLKPRNLFLAAPPEGGPVAWKILDFGVSKLIDGEGTQTRDIVGTPGYMAPEQAKGGEVTHQTDLFSLGAIAYRALTGRPPFSADHVVELMFQVTRAMPPRPSELVKVSPDVDLVLAIALAKSPLDRFDSGEELAVALDQAARGRLDPALQERAQAVLAKQPWGGKA